MTDTRQNIDYYLRKLFPICRSITGEGNRETLRTLQEIVPLKILEYPSDIPVYDWIIPSEWHVRNAYIKNHHGECVINLCHNNLHVMSYSQAVRAKMTLEELEPHLHYLEDLPDAIPYRTTYYNEDWGFCLTYHQYQSLRKDGGEFEVLIDSSFKNGSLTVGELIIEGKNPEEFLISTYICHPSLANDNLSGMILTALLGKELLSRNNLNRSYRIIFVPETIGAITYCAMNEKAMRSIDVGLVVSTVGGPGQFGYKQSFDKSHCINRLIEQTFTEEGREFFVYPFDIHGSDERQYSSPGFRINTATICKDKYYEYPGYHTSLDNLDFVKSEYIHQTLQIYLKLIENLEKASIPSASDISPQTQYETHGKELVYRNLYPNCEVMLSKYDLYPKTGGGLNFNNRERVKEEIDLILWLLFYCDGKRPLSNISKEIKVSWEELFSLAAVLEEKGILVRVDHG